MRRIIISALLLIATNLAAFCAESPFKASVGGQTILIPAPSNYVEVGLEKRQIFPSDIPNRLLAWFALPQELKTLGTSKNEGLTRHMQVQVSKKIEDQNLGPSDFNEIATMLTKQQDEIFASATDEVNNILKKMTSGTGISDLKLSQPKSLGSFYKSENVASFLMLMSMEVATKQGKRTEKVVCATNLMRVKDRLLFVYVYCNAEEKNSLDWVKDVSKTWTQAILNANQ